MDIDVNGISQRLQEVRKKLGYSQQKLSENVSISRSYIARVEQGLIPSSEFIIKLTKSINISIDWLVTGRGSMFLNDQGNDFYNIDEDTKELLKAINNIPNAHKSKVIKAILNLIDFSYE